MFKNICIKPNDSTFPNDIGIIAENMLYYEKVYLIASSGTITTLTRKCGVDTLTELLTRGNLKLLVPENLLGTMSQTLTNGSIINDVALISSKKLTTEEALFNGIYAATDRRGYSKRTTNKLLQFVEPIKYENDICDRIRDDLDDEKFVKQSIIDTIQFYNPELILSPSDIHYEKIKTESGFFFATNLNYPEINKLIPDNPTGKIITSTGLILNIQEARGDMHLASALNAEIYASPIHTQLMKLKFKDIFEKSKFSSDSLYQFNDFVFDNGHAIKEVINSGEKSLSDFLIVLDKASKFKNWLSKFGDDKNILKEYQKAVAKETWIDKLPGKSIRWAFFTGAGIVLDVIGTGGIGTAIGLGLSAGDTFLLDKIIKGWRPNVFIDKELKKFTSIEKK